MWNIICGAERVSSRTFQEKIAKAMPSLARLMGLGPQDRHGADMRGPSAQKGTDAYFESNNRRHQRTLSCVMRATQHGDGCCMAVDEAGASLVSEARRY